MVVHLTLANQKKSAAPVATAQCLGTALLAARHIQQQRHCQALLDAKWTRVDRLVGPTWAKNENNTPIDDDKYS